MPLWFIADCVDVWQQLRLHTQNTRVCVKVATGSHSPYYFLLTHYVRWQRQEDEAKLLLNFIKTAYSRGSGGNDWWGQGSAFFCTSMACCIFSTIQIGTVNGFSSSILTSGDSLHTQTHTHLQISHHGNSSKKLKRSMTVILHFHVKGSRVVINAYIIVSWATVQVKPRVQVLWCHTHLYSSLRDSSWMSSSTSR